MLFMARPDSKSVHALADLLEMIEVAADELLDQKLAPRDGAANGDAELESYLASLRQFSNRVRSLELTIVAKLEQARARARAVARTDWRLRPIMAMFTSGTQGYADHLAAHNDRDAVRFNAGDQIFPFLRSRELVPPLSTHYDGGTELLVTDSYRLLGLIKLRDLLENCEAALNALDAHYDLYDWQTDAEDAADDTEEAAVELRPDTAKLELVVAAAREAAIPVPEAEATPAPAATNWGESIEPVAALTAEVVVEDVPASASAEPEAVPALVVEPAQAPAGVAQTETTVAEPSPDHIEAVRREGEQSLKTLTERLADMKAAAEPAAGPEAADTVAA